MSRIGVIGGGYVGATTAACLAHLGHEVVCGDRDKVVVERLSKADVPMLEAQLPELIRDGIDAGRLSFATGAAAAAQGAEFVFLCVDTPPLADGGADLSDVDAAVTEIAPALSPGTIVVNKSTMPAGSARRVGRLLEELGVEGVSVASNPEFLSEGTAVREFLNPDRIVLGVDDEEVAVRLGVLYRKLQARIIVTDPASAEMVKYASNAYLATRISFMNSIAALCEAVGADVADVALGMGYDSRIGFSGLRPGPGYGGSCLPKDTAALLATTRHAGVEFEQLESTVAVNELQRRRIVDKVNKAAGGVLDGTLIGVWGLAFKAGTDDVRDSPAIDIVERLCVAGAVVRAYDPSADPGAVRARLPIETVPDAYAACEGAAVLAVLTEWDEFRWLDFGEVKRLMAGCAVVDARNLLDREALVRRGFDYQGVGR